MNTQDKLIKQWAADIGSNAKRVFADNIELVQATRIATNILKHDAKLLEQNQVQVLQAFLQAAQSCLAITSSYNHRLLACLRGMTKESFATRGEKRLDLFPQGPTTSI